MFFLFALTPSLNVGIAGAHGGLGRELVRQSMDRGWTPTALVRRDDPITEPIRVGYLSPDATHPVAMPVRRVVCPETCPESLDAIVFALSGRPFVLDTSSDVVRAMCASLPERCRKVCLVSAHGVGADEPANVGIRVMRDWYLRSTYEAKAEQESIVQHHLPDGVDRLILRPRVLSYSPIPLYGVATPRRCLASDILDWLARDGARQSRGGLL